MNILSSLLSSRGDQHDTDPSGIAVLVASNCIPLIGVLLFGWVVFDIVILYWFENVVIGVLNVVKILTAMPGKTLDAGETSGDAPTPGAQMGQTVASFHGIKLFLIPFFTFHYGLFCTVHGVFICALLQGDNHSGLDSPMAAVIAMMAQPWFAVAVVGLIASQVISLVRNYYISGKYEQSHPFILLFTPYGRIVILHLAILLSAFLTLVLGSPIWMLVLLVVGKTVMDISIYVYSPRIGEKLRNSVEAARHQDT